MSIVIINTQLLFICLSTCLCVSVLINFHPIRSKCNNRNKPLQGFITIVTLREANVSSKMAFGLHLYIFNIIIILGCQLKIRTFCIKFLLF